MPKIPLDMNVLTAARQRIEWTFDHATKICVSFSGGKDSTVMLHLVMDEARKRNRKVGVLFIDLEAQYTLTIDHIEDCYREYAEYIEPFWLSLPLHLRNAVSQYEPHWICWQAGREADWVRQPSSLSITSPAYFPWFREGMEFEELVDDFGHWYGAGEPTACMVGIRADESLNRYRTLVAKKERWENHSWTTGKGDNLYNVYPIYDWHTEDIWTYHGKYPEKAYNHLYDRMQAAGLSIHQQRICQPYGDDQRKGLWLYQIIEPETWGKVLARVNGANSGALYAQNTGNILGRIKITLPEGHTWESFSNLLLATMPPKFADHYKDKIATFIHWYEIRGYPDGIPDSGPLDKSSPSWRRVAKALLRQDYWNKGLGFSQTRSDAYDRYKKMMKGRRERWGI